MNNAVFENITMKRIFTAITRDMDVVVLCKTNDVASKEGIDRKRGRSADKDVLHSVNLTGLRSVENLTMRLLRLKK